MPKKQKREDYGTEYKKTKRQKISSDLKPVVITPTEVQKAQEIAEEYNEKKLNEARIKELIRDRILMLASIAHCAGRDFVDIKDLDSYVDQLFTLLMADNEGKSDDEISAYLYDRLHIDSETPRGISSTVTNTLGYLGSFFALSSLVTSASAKDVATAHGHLKLTFLDDSSSTVYSVKLTVSTPDSDFAPEFAEIAGKYMEDAKPRQEDCFLRKAEFESACGKGEICPPINGSYTKPEQWDVVCDEVGEARDDGKKALPGTASLFAETAVRGVDSELTSDYGVCVGYHAMYGAGQDIQKFCSGYRGKGRANAKATENGVAIGVLALVGIFAVGGISYKAAQHYRKKKSILDKEKEPFNVQGESTILYLDA